MTKLTPVQALLRLQEGNQRFRSGQSQARSTLDGIRETSAGAAPFAAVLGCIDSRVPPERGFDMGLGDLYCTRVAGNIVDDAVLASLEFACSVSGAVLLVVLGHSDCGAIKGACDGLQHGTLSRALEKLNPSIGAIKAEGLHGPESGSNPEFVTAVGRENVNYTLAEIKRRCPGLLQAEAEGTLDLVGAFYSVETGEVTFSDLA